MISKLVVVVEAVVDVDDPLFRPKDSSINRDAFPADHAVTSSAEGNMDFMLLQKRDAMAGLGSTIRIFWTDKVG